MTIFVCILEADQVHAALSELLDDTSILVSPPPAEVPAIEPVPVLKLVPGFPPAELVVSP